MTADEREKSDRLISRRESNVEKEERRDYTPYMYLRTNRERSDGGSYTNPYR